MGAIWPECGVDFPLQQLKAAFAAGALAPDMGFFPGGPRRFSEAVHRSGSSDFMRVLKKKARNGIEIAFAAGWASHIYADCAVHPLINQWATARAKAGRGDKDLWHLRLEWGMDCLLLEEDPDLEKAEVLWPHRGEEELLQEVAAQVYPRQISRQGLVTGQNTTAQWLRRLPWIYRVSGGCRPPKLRPVSRGLSLVLQPICHLGAALLAPYEKCRDVAAISHTHRPDSMMAQQLKTGVEQAMVACIAGWRDDFLTRPDLDLDTGLPPALASKADSPTEPGN
jgi:hypothetical protein